MTVESEVERVALKPCPFCDLQPKWRGDRSDYVRGIYRLQCLGETHLAQAYGPNEDACIAVWNTRAILAMSSPSPAGEDETKPFASQAEAWNDALEKAAQIVERYNVPFSDPECGYAPGDIRALKRATLSPPSPPSDEACAHCGSTNNNCTVDEREKVHPYRVTCKDCGCGTAHHGDFKAAWAAWKRRPASPPSDDVALPIGTRVIYENEAMVLKGTVVEHVEGWLKLQFDADETSAIVRPSRCKALNAGRS